MMHPDLTSRARRESMPAMVVVDRYDVLVVGSGFGGSVAALRLAEKGYRVAVLEAGKRYEAEDFARTNWNVRRFLWQPKLFCHGILRLTLLSDILVGSGAGVGGGSLVFANTLPVPRSEAFKRPDWPATKDWERALAPHYAPARRILGAVTNPRLTPADQILKECAEELGRGDTFQPTEVAVFFGTPGQSVPDPYFDGKGPDRSGCVFCGGCMVGCRHNAKNTLDKNYLYLAEKLGASIYPETQVQRIEKEESGATGSPAFAAPARSGAAGWSGRLRWSSWRRAFSARWTCCCARGTTVGWKACRRRSAFAFEPTARRSSAPPRAAAMSISPKALPSPQASIPTMSPTSSQCATRAGLTSSDCWPSR